MHAHTHRHTTCNTVDVQWVRAFAGAPMGSRSSFTDTEGCLSTSRGTAGRQAPLESTFNITRCCATASPAAALASPVNLSIPGSPHTAASTSPRVLLRSTCTSYTSTSGSQEWRTRAMSHHLPLGVDEQHQNVDCGRRHAPLGRCRCRARSRRH